MTIEPHDIDWPRLDDPAGPALPIGDDDARRMIEHALGGVRSLEGRSARAPHVRSWRTVLLVAAAITIAAVAVAAVGSVVRPFSSTPEPRPAAPSPAPSAAPPVGATARPSATQTPEVDVAPPAPVGDVPAVRATGRVVERGRTAPAPTVEAGAELERANRLRSQMRWSEANAAYEHVIQLAPTSRDAQTARIASADLRLRQLHDPAGAQRLFTEAQRRGGPLAQEAGWGLVEAHRALGDRESEARAISRFLEAFPSSAMAAQARARAAELSSSSR